MIKIFTSFIGNDVPNVYPWAGNDGVRSCGIVATFNSSEENWKCSLGPGPTYSKSSSESYNMYTSVKLEHIKLTLLQPRGKGVTVTPPPYSILGKPDVSGNRINIITRIFLQFQ